MGGRGGGGGGRGRGVGGGERVRGMSRSSSFFRFFVQPPLCTYVFAMKS